MRAVDVDIFVTTKLPDKSFCRFCKTSEVLLRTEVENDTEMFIINLCKGCASELHAQLGVMLPPKEEIANKLLNAINRHDEQNEQYRDALIEITECETLDRAEFIALNALESK